MTTRVQQAVRRELRALGFSVEDVVQATCYLTPAGMHKLRPCGWAIRWMWGRPRVLVTEKLFAIDWWLRFPAGWLQAWEDAALGPAGGWPWGRRLRGSYVSAFECALLLKAYIMKHGRRTAPKGN